jgi:hypothetical protein
VVASVFSEDRGVIEAAIAAGLPPNGRLCRGSGPGPTGTAAVSLEILPSLAAPTYRGLFLAALAIARSLASDPHAPRLPPTLDAPRREEIETPTVEGLDFLGVANFDLLFEGVSETLRAVQNAARAGGFSRIFVTGRRHGVRFCAKMPHLDTAIALAPLDPGKLRAVVKECGEIFKEVRFSPDSLSLSLSLAFSLFLTLGLMPTTFSLTLPSLFVALDLMPTPISLTPSLPHTSSILFLCECVSFVVRMKLYRHA